MTQTNTGEQLVSLRSETSAAQSSQGDPVVVDPAAGLIRWARNNQASVIEVNLTATAASALADVSLQGPSGTLLPELVKRL